MCRLIGRWAARETCLVPFFGSAEIAMRSVCDVPPVSFAVYRRLLVRACGVPLRLQKRAAVISRLEGWKGVNIYYCGFFSSSFSV